MKLGWSKYYFKQKDYVLMPASHYPGAGGTACPLVGSSPTVHCQAAGQTVSPALQSFSVKGEQIAGLTFV